MKKPIVPTMILEDLSLEQRKEFVECLDVVGNNTHRLLTQGNELELLYAYAWDCALKENKNLLSHITGSRDGVSEQSIKDIASVIQWLGSPVGSVFLRQIKSLEQSYKK